MKNTDLMLLENPELDEFGEDGLEWNPYLEDKPVKRRKKRVQKSYPSVTTNTMLVALAVVIVALVAARIAQGHWLWQGLGKPQLAAPRSYPSRQQMPTADPKYPSLQQITASGTVDPTAGQRFVDSSYSSTGEPLGPSGEQVGLIFG